VPTIIPARRLVTRQHMVKCGRIVLFDVLTETLRMAAVRRSLNFVLSVTYPRPMRLVITTIETVALKISPIPVMILPRPIEVVNVEELSAEPIV